MEQKPPKFTEMHPAIQHLTQDEVSQLCLDYPLFSKNDLILKYRLQTKLGIYALLPGIYNGELCEHCNSEMVEYIPQKQSKDLYGRKICTQCNHTVTPAIHYYECCSCTSCKERAMAEYNERKLKHQQQENERNAPYIQYVKANTYKPYTSDSIPLKYKVHLFYIQELQKLLSLEGRNKNSHFITYNFTPCINYLQWIAVGLYNNQLLRFAENIDYDYIKNFIKDDNIIPLIEKKILLINCDEININTLKVELENNQSIKTELWSEIATYECLGFYLLRFENSLHTESQLHKLVKLFEDLTLRYDVGQIFNLISISIENASAKNKNLYDCDNEFKNSCIETIENYEKLLVRQNKILYRFNNGKPYKYSTIHNLFFQNLLSSKVNTFNNVIPQEAI